jgi:hypothetical protein
MLIGGGGVVPTLASGATDKSALLVREVPGLDYRVLRIHL